jgi:hypothetical protein
MDEQNMNPYGDGGQNGSGTGTQDPYGTNEQNPYGGNGAQDPYGTNGAQNPYGGAGQNPYGVNEPQNPYGAGGVQSPYGAQNNPYGGAGQNPYGGNGTQDPYGAGAQNPYGSNGAPNPYAQQMYPNVAQQNPYQGAVPAPKPPKKKLSKKAKILIFGGIGLAALAVAAVFLCIYVFFPAKKTLEAAVRETLNGEMLVQKSVLGKEIGFSELNKAFTTEGGEVEADLTLHAQNEKVDGLGIKLDAAIDQSAKQLSAEIDLSRNGKEFIKTDIFGDADQTYVTVEDLLKGYYSITNKGFLKALMNSPIVQKYMAESSASSVSSVMQSLPDIDLNFFGGTAGNVFDADKFFDSEFWKEVKIGREGSETLNIGSDSVKAKKYSITIPKEKLQEWASNAIDQTMSSMGSMNVGGMDLSQYGGQVKSMIKSVFSEDVILYAYVADDKVISIVAQGTLNLLTYKIGYKAEFVCYSTDTTSTIKLNASLEMMNQAVIDAKFSVVTKSEGDSINTDVVGTLGAAGQDYISLTYSQKYGKSDRVFSGTGSMSVKGSSAGDIRLNGKVDEVDPGKSLKITIEEASIGKMDINLSGTISIKTKSSGAEVKSKDSSKPVVNILTASEEEIKSLVDQNSQVYKDFMKTLGGAGGREMDGIYVITEMDGKKIEDTLKSYEEQGIVYTPEQICTLEFYGEEKFRMTFLDNVTEGTYSVSGDTLKLEADGDTANGTIEGGVIILNVNGSTMKLEKK